MTSASTSLPVEPETEAVDLEDPTQRDRNSDSPQRSRSDVIIAQTDGEVIRGRRRIKAEDRDTLSTVSALMSVVMGEGQFPASLDVRANGKRFMAVAFDSEIMFMRIGGPEASRAEFLEEMRQKSQ